MRKVFYASVFQFPIFTFLLSDSNFYASVIPFSILSAMFFKFQLFRFQFSRFCFHVSNFRFSAETIACFLIVFTVQTLYSVWVLIIEYFMLNVYFLLYCNSTKTQMRQNVCLRQGIIEKSNMQSKLKLEILIDLYSAFF